MILPMDDQAVLTAAEMMKALRMSRGTFYRFIKTGELRTFLDGSRRKGTAGAVRDYIKLREQQTAAERADLMKAEG